MAQDALYPMYEAQLNAYAWIGERCGLAPVSGLALLYTEPMTDALSVAEDAHHRQDSFLMGFSAKVVPVTLDVNLLAPLLAKAREIHDLPSSPAARDGCVDCRRLEAILDLLRA